MLSTDLDQLQGTWYVTSLEVDGEKMTVDTLGGAKIVIKGDRFTSVSMGTTYEGTVELQQTKKVKTFDLLFTAGPEKGNRNLGIYELAGDRWTICLATRGARRPGTFAAKPGTGFALEVLERKRVGSRTTKGKSQRTAPGVEPSGVATDLEGEWEMISGVFSGNALEQNMVQWCKRITRGDVTAVVAGPQTMLKASFTLNNSLRPHAIDYLNLHGATKGKAQAGIYEFKDGTLRICMSPPGKPRPKDFSSKSADGRSYTTWRRIESVRPQD